MVLSQWPCFTWKFSMIWFHKFLKLIFRSRHHVLGICTQYWRKLPNLTAFLDIFLLLKKSSSIEHTHKVLIIVLFIYFQGKIQFSRCIWFIWLSGCLETKCSAILLSKMESLFFSLSKFIKFHMSFLKVWPFFLQILHQSSMSWNITPLHFSSSNIIYFGQQEPIKVLTF